LVPIVYGEYALRALVGQIRSRFGAVYDPSIGDRAFARILYPVPRFFVDPGSEIKLI
jgi:hypothetical protein